MLLQEIKQLLDEYDQKKSWWRRWIWEQADIRRIRRFYNNRNRIGQTSLNSLNDDDQVELFRLCCLSSCKDGQPAWDVVKGLWEKFGAEPTTFLYLFKPCSLESALSIMNVKPLLSITTRWKSLFANRRYILQIADAINALYRPNSFWRANPANFLTKGNFKLVIANAAHADKLASAVSHLRDDNWVTAENFRILAENAKYAKKLAKGIKELKAGNFLTDENLQMLIKNAMHASDHAWSIRKLRENNLLTTENFKVLVENSQYTITLAQILIKLHEHNLLTDANRLKIATNAQYAEKILNAIDTLRVYGFSNGQLVTGLTDDNFSILAENFEYVDVLAEILCLLQKDIKFALTTEIRQNIIKYPKDMLECLKCLKIYGKSHPVLLTQENCTMFFNDVIRNGFDNSQTALWMGWDYSFWLGQFSDSPETFPVIFANINRTNQRPLCGLFVSLRCFTLFTLENVNAVFARQSVFLRLYQQCETLFHQVPGHLFTQNFFTQIIQLATNENVEEASQNIYNYINNYLEIHRHQPTSPQQNQINYSQSIHNDEVEKSVVESAERLRGIYGAVLKQPEEVAKTIEEIKKFTETLDEPVPCDLLFMSTSPLGKAIPNLKQPTYILGPDGLYFVSDTNKPVSEENFIKLGPKNKDEDFDINVRINELWQGLSGNKNPHDMDIKELSADQQEMIKSITDHSPKQQEYAAKKTLTRIIEDRYFYREPQTQLSMKDALILVWKGLWDKERRHPNTSDATARNALITQMDDIQRGYNKDDDGKDKGGVDKIICTSGTFNKVIVTLNTIHPDVEIIFKNNESAGLKVQALVKEAVKKYLSTIENNPEQLQEMLHRLEKENLSSIKEIAASYEADIARPFFEEFGEKFANVLSVWEDTDISEIITDYRKKLEQGKSSEKSPLQMHHLHAGSQPKSEADAPPQEIATPSMRKSDQ